MALISFTSHLQRHLDCPDQHVSGVTLREVLETVFKRNPPLKGYVLDDANHVREHVVIFVDGEIIRDRTELSDAVTEQSQIYVMQALSGG